MVCIDRYASIICNGALSSFHKKGYDIYLLQITALSLITISHDTLGLFDYCVSMVVCDSCDIYLFFKGRFDHESIVDVANIRCSI